MEDLERRKIEYLCEDLFERGKNSVLIFGPPEQTRRVLKAVYDAAREKEEFLCSWHEASAINHPMQFYEPILRAKYGPDYDSLAKNLHFGAGGNKVLFRLSD